MDRLTPRKPLTFKFGVNHETKLLELTIHGTNDSEAKGTLNIEEIDRLIASLSQCQHALVVSKAGGEELMPPFDETQPFQAHGGYILAQQDSVARYKVGVLC